MKQARMDLDYYIERPLWQHLRHSAREHGYKGIAVLYYLFLVLFRYYVCLSVYSWIPTSGMRVWFLRRIGVKIGRNVQIGPLNWFDFVWPEYIEVGDGTSLAGMTTIIAHSTPLHHLRGYFESYVGPVRIGKNVWIAVNCTILPNLSIGDCSVVAAGAVVTRDVEANVFVAEVPAKVIRRFDLNEPSERIHTESKLEHERCSRELNKEGVNHD